MTLPSASQLLHHLGGDVFVLPLPDDGSTMQQVGTLLGLPVWTMRATAAETLRQARRLGRRGQLGLVISCDPATHRWLLAVTLQPVRLAIVSDGDLNALPIRRLVRAARHSRATPLADAIALAEALDVDAAGRRTFGLLHHLLERAVTMLPTVVPREERHAWALAQMTRLLFLRFVESEGWLDGNPRFLAEAFDRCLIAKRDPTRHLLHPLFFGTLNRASNDRSRLARSFGAIPFLNGGLFEPHAVERRHQLHLPVAYWRDVFDSLVDRIDVTLDANADDGRVTPELLGRVFEGVMHPLERKRQGTFFTPPPLVDALLRQALACHLSPKLQRSEEAIEQSLDDPDVELRRALLDVTVLDPAVGSGAFLVGALGLLHGPGPRLPARVRHLVTRRLFGVDRHPGAVRLCELRLWLEVLRAMRSRPAGHVPPLPNLDARVRAGDALIDPLHEVIVDSATARSIRARQRAILGAHGAEKRRAISNARGEERAAVLAAIGNRENAMDWVIAELVATARAPTLFGDRPTLGAAHRREIAFRRRQRAEIRTERRRLVRDASATPFAIRVAYAPVVSGRGGFDLVVGNPPWVRAEQLPMTTRDALAARYRWWRSGTGSGWRHLPDLSVAFLERGFEMLAPGGTLSFLVPAKLATAGYAAAARAALVARSTIHRVADLGDDPRAGFEATTYPLAVIASRRIPPAGHMVRLGLQSGNAAQPQAAWREGSPWLTASPAAQRVAARLAHDHPSLAHFVTPQLGVKTGANSAFLNPPADLRRYCRSAVRGRDVRPFTISSSAWLLWPADRRGAPWPLLPADLTAYLEPEVGRLQRRADQQGGPWWQLFRTRAATAPHRVIWRDLSPGLHAAVLHDTNAVPLNSCYVAAVGSTVIAESLAAWLNASPIRAIARMRAEPAAGGYARFAARTISALPLPQSAVGHPTLASLARAGASDDVQLALDTCVSQLLGLTTTEHEVLIGMAADRR